VAPPGRAHASHRRHAQRRARHDLYLRECDEQITLESRVKAISQLQGETLDHLREAVAVFGTDARLRLFNPVFASIWRLSPTRLREEPHINEIIGECRAIYSDDAAWETICTAVTDLDHDDQAGGRMERPDGSVIDYARSRFQKA
jgi:hypothetical protein